MTIWHIRYSDKNGRKHALFHEQSTPPSDNEAYMIVIRQLRDLEQGNKQVSHVTALAGIEILGIESIPPSDATS